MAPDPERAVLSRYPSAVAGLDWSPLGSAGGFSGAAIWRGDLAGQPAFALKAWPPDYPADRLAAVHRWMAEARHTGLVSAVVPTRDGGTLVEHAGRVWDVTAWVPGAADFRREPSDAKLAAACAALAALHRCWAPTVPQLAPCPGVLRRLTVLRDFLPTLLSPSPLVGEGRGGGFGAPPSREHRPSPVKLTPHPNLPPQGGREQESGIVPLGAAIDLLRSHVPPAIDALRPWADRPVPVFPCLCDIWHDHVFFAGNRVTGIIDYGAMKIDHPAVDLARLLGDLADGSPDRMRVGLDTYRDASGPVAIDPDFVSVLERTGLVCAVIHWVNRPEFTQPGHPQITERVTRLIGRLAGL